MNNGWQQILLVALSLGGCDTPQRPGGVDNAVGISVDEIDVPGDVVEEDSGRADPEDTGDVESEPATQDDLFACDGELGSSPARIRRINRQEWTRTVGAGLGSPQDTNPFDPPSSLPYSTYSGGVSLDPATLDLYFNVAAYGGVSWTEREARGAGVLRLRTPYEDRDLRCIWQDADPDDDCIDTFVQKFLEGGVLFRAPRDDERAQLRAFLIDALADEADGGLSRVDTLQKVTTGAWLTSGALFRTELGQGDPDAADRYRLGDAELGRMLAQMLSDRAPGTTGTFRWKQGPEGSSWTAPIEGHLADIRAAQEDGSIQNPDTIRALIRTHAAGTDLERYDLNNDVGADRRARRGEYWMAHKIERFFIEWFDVASFPNDFKDTPHATSAFGGDAARNLGSSYRNLQTGYYGDEPMLLEQFTDTIARIVAEDQDVLERLLTTRRFYVAADAPYIGASISASTVEVNRVYGITGSIAADRAAQWVELPADERAGMLTHPAWLAAHGDNFEDGASLVLRGHWIREALLCQDVPGLESVTVEAQLSPSDGTRSARQRVEADIETRAECMACHVQMNSLGKPFEIYNHAGFLRADDHGQPPNGSTVVDDRWSAEAAGVSGSYDSAVDFSTALAASPHVKRCFIRQTFRSFMGRDETVADGCALSAMEQAYDDSGGSFVAMLEALATSDAALYRHRGE